MKEGGGGARPALVGAPLLGGCLSRTWGPSFSGGELGQQGRPWGAQAVSQAMSGFLSSCRFYLISGGVPFIICGVTAATNIRNYGTEDEDGP